MAVGNLLQLTSTVTAGIVSAKARTLGVYGIGGVESLSDRRRYRPGNSGGAGHAKGELVVSMPFFLHRCRIWFCRFRRRDQKWSVT